MAKKKSKAQKARQKQLKRQYKLQTESFVWNAEEAEKIVQKSVQTISKYRVLIAGIIGALIFMYGPILAQNAYNYYLNLTTPAPIVKDYYPTRISIPEFKLSIPVKEATVSGNVWQLYDNEASWLKGTGNLNIGNIVIYAHNRKYLFGRLQELDKGDILQLESKLGTKEYTITETIDGTPEDIEPLLSNENQLTLYTCNGWWDTKRYIVIAKPTSALKPHNPEE